MWVNQQLTYFVRDTVHSYLAFNLSIPFYFFSPDDCKNNNKVKNNSLKYDTIQE